MKRVLMSLSTGLLGVVGLISLAQANCGSMGACPPSSSGKIAFLLLGLAAGYWVLTLAEASSNVLKIVGRVVGWVILVVAAGGLLCSAIFGMCRMRSCSTMSMPGCPMMGHKMGDHGMMSMPPAEQNPAEENKK